jgi:PAS domain S-box-containing protein
MGDTARYSTLHRFAELEKRSRLVRKSVGYSLLALFARCFSLSLLYYVLVVVSMKLRFSTSGLSLLWPSNALLIATLVLTPKRRWWVYLLSVIPAHIAALSPYHLGFSWLAYQIAFNSIQAIACALILQRFRPVILYFETLKEVLIFLGVAVVVPGLANLVAIYPVVKFSPSRAALLAHNSSDGFLSVWTSCWANNSASLIVFVPVILVCVTRGRDRIRSLSWRRVGEGALLTVLLTTLTFLGYGGVRSVGDALPFVYLIPIPFLIWAAVRFGPPGACLSITLFVCVSSWCAYLGEGPFLRSVSIDRVTVLQMFWIIISAPLLCLATVVRERKVAVEELRESEDKLRLLLDSTAEAIYGIDLEHRCTFCNLACLRTLGYGRLDEVLGKNMHNLIHHTRADGTSFPVEECGVHRVTRTGEGVHAEDEMFWRANGTSFPAEYWSYPQRRGEEVVGAVVAFVDITERKQAETALANVSRKLIEAQEQERTRIGRELHDDVTQRLAMLAVELEQLQDNPSELRSRVQELRKQTTEISNDVQALSHELHSSKVEYLGAVRGMKSWCNEFSERRGLQIEFQSPDAQIPLPREIGLSLFRVLQEALHNSAKHSGVKRIEVQLREDSGEVHLVVSDLGRGFDVGTAMQGRGLGLASMQERVRLVNGTIEIQSKPTGGTTVHVCVSLRLENAPQRVAG